MLLIRHAATKMLPTLQTFGFPASLALAWILLLLVSCDPDRIFDQMQKIPGQEWNSHTPVRINLPVTDTMELTNMYIQVRNTTDYPYANLFLFIITHDPDGKISRDTLECLMALPEGQWTGKGLGKIKENRFLFKQGMRWPKKGIYQLELQQAMRAPLLKGITDVGIRIEKD